MKKPTLLASLHLVRYNQFVFDCSNSNPMKPLERSNALQQEADHLLELLNLLPILQAYGEVTITGSYYLHTMVFPDIDLHLTTVSIPQLFDIAAHIAAHDLTTEIRFQRSRIPRLPGGLYLKAYFDCGDWERPWKLDIWSLDDALIHAQNAEMQAFRHKLTDELREAILNYKCSIFTPKHRPPVMSGYFIYKAFLDLGLTDDADVTRYLVENGVVMD
jgi:hypothetical protein